jgi:hypothetical protein
MLKHHEAETDDSVFTINIVTIVIFFLIICCLFVLCFVWDSDFNSYRAPKEQEIVIKHVIVKRDHVDYV